MKAPKVSFVVVNWNTQHVLAGCIDSIVREAGGLECEIVVVDNASTDGSQEYLRRNYPQVKLIENENNLGFSKANNIGIEHSSSPILFLINSDVIVLPNCISSMERFMRMNHSIGLSGPKIFNNDMLQQTSCSKYPSLWNMLCGALALNRIFPRNSLFSDWRMDYWDHNMQREVQVISGCFWVVRRKALNDVGTLDERFFIYGEDIDWSKRFNESGWKVVFNPDASAIHLGARSSRRAPIKYYVEMNKANLDYWCKYHGKYTTLLYKIISFLHHSLRVGARMPQIVLANKEDRPEIVLAIRRSMAIIQWLIST